jgi:hypothetical protein
MVGFGEKRIQRALRAVTITATPSISEIGLGPPVMCSTWTNMSLSPGSIAICGVADLISLPPDRLCR